MPHSVGIIDCDYCGPEDEIKLQFFNTRSEPVTLPAGSKIAQGIFVKVEQADFAEVDDIDARTRGGFGSTDAK